MLEKNQIRMLEKWPYLAKFEGSVFSWFFSLSCRKSSSIRSTLSDYHRVCAAHSGGKSNKAAVPWNMISFNILKPYRVSLIDQL